MEVANVYVDYKLSVEEGTSFFKVVAQCFIYNDFQDQPVQIGEAYLHLFDPSSRPYLDLCGEADNLSDKLSYSVKQLEKFCEVDKINGMIAVFHTSKFEESWDGRGLATSFYDKLEEQLSLLNVEWIIISNSRNQASVDKTTRLLSFINFGFNSLQKEKEPVLMFKQISRTYAL